MHKYLLTAGVLVALVLSVTAFVVMPDGVTERVKEVAVGGPEKTQHQFFKEGYTAGGDISTTSTATTYTTAKQDFFNEPTTVKWTPNQNITLNVSATSTHGYVPNVGDVSNVYFQNASTTAAATVTFAAEDAGVDIQHADGGNLVLNGNDWAKLTLIRTNQNLVTVIMDEMAEGD